MDERQSTKRQGPIGVLIRWVKRSPVLRMTLLIALASVVFVHTAVVAWFVVRSGPPSPPATSVSAP